jgi:hypothetical protein
LEKKSVQKISKCKIKNRGRKETGENCLNRNWTGTEKKTIRKNKLKMIDSAIPKRGNPLMGKQKNQ